MVPPGCRTVDRRADIVAVAARRGVVGPQVDAKLMMTHASSNVCDAFTSKVEDERTRLLLSQIDDTARVGAAARRRAYTVAAWRRASPGKMM